MKISSKMASFSALAIALSACGGSGSETSAPAGGQVSPGVTITPPPATTTPPPVTTTPPPPVHEFASAYTPLLQQIYIAFYGRPADPGGLTLWGQQLSDANMPKTLSAFASSYATNPAVKQVVDNFASGIEARDNLSGTSAAFVNTVYLNAFNRVAEPTASVFWSALVDEGQLTRAQTALLIMSGAQGSDTFVVSTKTQAAIAVTAGLKTPAIVATYTSGSSLQGARELLSSITATTDADALKAQVDAYIASIPSEPGTYATIARYVGYSTAQRPTGKPSYSAHYDYGTGGTMAPGRSGTLTYGLNPTTVSWTRGALDQIDYGTAFMASASIKGTALLPAVTMLCRPLTPASPVPKSTDVLVSLSARQLGVASLLAGRTLSTYRVDCGVSSVAQSISFDNAGNATFKTAAGASQIDAATVSAGLNGAMLHDAINNLNFYIFAYSYARADGTTGVALVQRTSVPATTGTAILPAESVAVWSQE